MTTTSGEVQGVSSSSQAVADLKQHAESYTKSIEGINLIDTVNDGVVIYCDGSFRRNKGGWGIHLYGYENKPLTRSIGIKMLPTKQGYIKTELSSTVTPLFYYDSWGHLGRDATNNTAELKAATESLKLIKRQRWDNALIFTDSEYVRKGLNQWVKGWQKNDWMTAKGTPVANKDLWLELLEVQNELLAMDIKPKLEWTKGHANHPGNDAADLAARAGSGTEPEFFSYVSEPEGYHKPKLDVSDLILKKWLVFDVSQPEVNEDGHHYYHMFNLNSSNAYGKKKEDSLRTRHSKTATLFGRRMSDATFTILRTKEPDEHLETLKELHRKSFARDIIELGILCLEVGLKPTVYENVRKFGSNYLTAANVNRSLTTPHDELLSITVSPPKMALDGAQLFNSLERTMINVINGVEKRGVTTFDVTDHFFTEHKNKLKLKEGIQQTTSHLMIPASFQGVDIKIRTLLGIDIPTRNMLNRMTGISPKVTLIITAESPTCYQFAYLFETDIGDVFYQSPYIRFLLPKDK